MRLIHFLARHWESPFTGVNRFSRYFQQAFPEIVNITPQSAWTWEKGDVVVTDNHMCMDVPEYVPCIVVHHGCAPWHYQADPEWRSPATLFMAAQQQRMFKRPRTIFVAPSTGVRDMFRHCCLTESTMESTQVIPHWVPLIPMDRAVTRPLLPCVIGDWRNFNKGVSHIGAIAAADPDFTFKQLNFPGNDDALRLRAYQGADCYLCLSLSEGAPYAVADAEAAGLAIVTTPVGFHLDFMTRQVINDRGNVADVLKAIYDALDWRDRHPNRRRFFEAWTFEKWKEAWRDVIEKAAAL